MDMAEFLTARLDEDAQAARLCSGMHLSTYLEGDDEGWAVESSDGDYGAIIGGQALAEHIARHDPARVLADVAAKRAILADHHRTPMDPEWCDRCDTGESLDNQVSADYPCPTLLALAQPYAEHPDFDPAWSVSLSCT